MSLDISKEDAVRLREIEVKKLVANEWKVLHEELPIIQKSKGRKDIKDIPTMNRIKEIVRQRIGYVATFIFLHTVGTICGWLEGPYRNVGSPPSSSAQSTTPPQQTHFNFNHEFQPQ
ncbi:hypothetical protein FDP41_012100 [Naegleria fowleri]|uniref:Uncharacterized protein n=1 Tax=Naegleria fowleri TaxID=5763 RepID=A0A6A5BTM6_NAEFO|nr:uncharacterized protein FDP41_012100 [Naegleria fowleri]KAF0981443.1 hypothetical protein FDP41_012100 [Naegleria fowleri]CAG4714289.1 unnamed protein product [Naegleria fowleri]